MTFTLRARLSVLGLALLLLSACGPASGTLVVEAPKARAIPEGKVVALDIVAGQDVEGEDFKDAADRLRNDLSGRLVAEGLFKQVVAAGEPADYRLNMDLSAVDEVGHTALFLWGSMAGTNTLAAEVTLVDAASGATVTRFRVTGEAGSRVRDSTLDSAVREAAAKTAQGLK